jgi:hypothetical protein
MIIRSKYLSEDNNFQFTNSYLDKTLTGNGATHFALTDTQIWAIFFPYISLVQSKLNGAKKIQECLYRKQNANGMYTYIVAVFGSVTHKQVQSAINAAKTTDAWKLVSTYDGIEKVAGCLNSVERIMIDEAHCMTTDYGHRKEAIDTMVDVLEQYKEKVTAITATPTDYEYAHPFLKSLPFVKLKYNNIAKRNGSIINTNDPIVSLSKDVVAWLKDGVFRGRTGVTNLCIALNSVEGIVAFCKLAGIEKNDVAVLCAEKIDNLNKLKTIGLKIGDVNRALNKKITLYTCGYMQGCDFVGKLENGSLPILCLSSDYIFGQVDIATLGVQAIGRARKSERNDFCVYVNIRSAVKVGSDTVPYDFYVDSIEKDINEIHNDSFEAVKKMTFDFLRRNYTKFEYASGNNAISFKHNDFSVDAVAYNAEIYLKAIVKRQYLSIDTVVEQFDKELFNVEVEDESVTYVKKVRTNETADKKLEHYHEMMSGSVVFDDETRRLYMLEEDMVEAYDFLGADEVVAMKFNYKKAITKYKKLNKGTKRQMCTSLESIFGYKVGDFVSLDEIKDVLNTRGKELGLNVRFTAEDIMLYVKAKKAQRVIDGKRQNGFVFEEFTNDAFEVEETLSVALEAAKQANNINSHKEVNVAQNKTSKYSEQNIYKEIEIFLNTCD